MNTVSRKCGRSPLLCPGADQDRWNIPLESARRRRYFPLIPSIPCCMTVDDKLHVISDTCLESGF